MLDWAAGELARIRERGLALPGDPDDDSPAPLRESRTRRWAST